jgi:hypothetical protein
MKSSFRVYEVRNQREALTELAKLVERGSVDPRVRAAAIILSKECKARDESCEIEAVFTAVKRGDPRIRGLGQGVKYVNDNPVADGFVGPGRLLQNCAEGACAEDCDGHAALICSLLLNLGFVVALRAYGKSGSKGYEHVYAMVRSKKTGKFLGLDTTVPKSYVGWEPPKGNVLTAVIGAD